MDWDSAGGNPAFGTLGDRVRGRREARGLSQEEVGRPHFTAHYVAAIERGAITPSRLALETVAQRLGVPAGDLSATNQDSGALPDRAAVAEDLRYQLDYANMLRHQNRCAEALAAIAAAEQWAAPYLFLLPASSRYRIPYLRGLTYLSQMQPAPARLHLEAALDMAGDDTDAMLRIRNFLGVAFYEMEQPQLALRQHLFCLETLRQDRRGDWNLRLSVYRNLANVYWALDDISRALDTYQEALAVLKDLNEPERKAGVYWGLSMAYKAIGEWTRSRLYAAQALSLYERANNQVAATKMRMNLAEIAIETMDATTADQLLAQAQAFLAASNDAILLSSLYLDWANLARLRNNPDLAGQFIELSLEHSAAACHQEELTTPRAQWYLARAHAEALHTAALIAEDRGHYAAADGLFQQALETIKQTGFKEMAHKIHRSYAEALTVRGDHAQATQQYQEAGQYRRRPLN